MIEAAKGNAAHPLRALANRLELTGHTAPKSWLKHALTRVDESRIPKVVSAATYYNTAYAHEEAGAKAREIEHVTKADGLFPDAGTKNNLGVALFFKRGNTYGKALGYYLKAAKINPYDADTHGNLAEVYRHLGQPKLALRHVKRALDLMPGHDVATEELGKWETLARTPGHELAKYLPRIEEILKNQARTK